MVGLVACQPQPVVAVTERYPDAPSAGTEIVVGETANVQLAACVTVIGVPATVNVPVRGLVDVFAATVYEGFAEPLHRLSPGTWIHGTEVEVNHTQPLGAVTATDPVTPAAGALIDVVDTTAVQLAPWATVTVVPATTNVPVRALVDVFAATVYATLPVPLPVPAASAIQGVALAAVQPQPVDAVTPTVPVPPPAAADTAVGETANVQLDA